MPTSPDRRPRSPLSLTGIPSSGTSGLPRGRRSHLYLYDIASKKNEVLTPGAFQETSPAWSPDGRQIAFIRRHGEGDVDKAPNQDLFVIDARVGAQPVRLTTTTAHEGGRPAWSPDGRTVAYLLGDETKYSAYDQDRLAIVPASGGEPRTLTDALDRPVVSPVWLPDGKSIVVGVVDDRSEHIASVPVSGGTVQKLITGKRVIGSFSAGTDGAFAVLASTATEVAEIYALEKGSLRRLSRHNDDWFATLQLGTTEELTSISKDGTEVHSLVVKPPASARAEVPDPAADSWRPERAGRALVQLRAGALRRQWLCRRRRQLSRQQRPRQRVSEGHLRGLGQQGGHGPSGRDGRSAEEGDRRSRSVLASEDGATAAS